MSPRLVILKPLGEVWCTGDLLGVGVGLTEVVLVVVGLLGFVTEVHFAAGDEKTSDAYIETAKK